MAIKIEMLRCFKMVVECGSLETASLRLNRTPSAISMMLKQFEDHLELPLFVSHRKTKLTPMGEQIYAIAHSQVSQFDQSIDQIQSLSRAITGRVKIAATPSIAITVLPSLLQTFIARHPNTQIELRDMTSTQVCETMIQQQADIGIACQYLSNDLYCKQVFSDPFGVVCRKDHPKISHWDSLTWADMHDEYVILNELCAYIHDPDFSKIRAHSRLMVPSISSLLGMIRAGIGISVLPALTAQLLEPDLIFLPLKAPQAKRDIFVITQPQSHLTDLAQELLQAIESFYFKRVAFQQNLI